jgi:CRP-like cAMP-binding protein
MAVTGLFVNATVQRELAAGDVVFAEGDAGRQMFGVVSGEIELRHDGRAVTRIGPDGTFGELAIIDHAPRSLTAVATAPSTVAVIDESTFLYLVHETPMFALQVMRGLTARLRERDETSADVPPA